MFKLENMSFTEALEAMKNGWGVSRRNSWMTGKIKIGDEVRDKMIFFTIENDILMKYERFFFGENRWVKCKSSEIESKDRCSNDWYIIDIDWEK